MTYQLAPNVRPTRKHMQDVGRQSSFLENSSEENAAADSRPWIRLEHHGVTHRQRRGQGANREHQRSIERCDHTNNTNRNPTRE